MVLNQQVSVGNQADVSARQKHRSARRAVAVTGLAACLVSGIGCSTMARWAMGGWVADYDSADRRVMKTGSELLIHYTVKAQGGTDKTARALHSAKVKRRIDSYVRCRLFKSYEPDRRYVAQFGVHRAPALIIVHRNGTYHSQAGPMSPEGILAFVHEAQESGRASVYDPHIPRRVEYRWIGGAGDALELAQKENKPMLIVFHRWMSADWDQLKPLLGRPEVFARFRPMVHCKQDSFFSEARERADGYGVRTWPALVIVESDGGYRVLQEPTSYEQIVRFADGRGPDGATNQGGSVTAASGS